MTRLLPILILVLLTTAAIAGTPSAGDLYVVATAHLDTQWRWTVRTTIDEYLPASLRENFALFDAYPGYVFSFEGAFRYQLAKEYYPDEYERLKGYIAADRWRVAGSWLDAVDVNLPSPESLFRQALYGNGYFAREFGVRSRDVFLPDCFGFGYALPSIAAHSGLIGFSTQKLSWGCFVGTPFHLGVWEGVDGSSLVAAVDPGSYGSEIDGDLSADPDRIATVAAQAEISGVAKGMMYFGTGDSGGSPTEASVAWLQKSLAGEGPLRVIPAGSDQIMRDLTPGERAALPRYRGELVMTRHGAGCYTSQAAMKRWNRANEILADAAERASVAADWLGAAPYPGALLETAWTRFLWHQFHDDLTGTSIPEAYAISWNDELLSLNQFAGVLTDAAGGVIRALDTRAEGVPVVVYNPLSIARADLVDAAIAFPDGPPRAVRVFGPDGAETPAQWADGRVVFLARVPSVGFAVYDVRSSDAPGPLSTGLSADGTAVLESARYRVSLGADGSLTAIRDKRLGRDLLAGPLEFQLLDDAPNSWAAWEIDHDDLSAPPRTLAAGEGPWSIIDAGPARVSARSVLHADGSTITMTVILGAGGAADRIGLDLDIDWRTPGTLLKAAFPMAAGDSTVTYDLGLGVIGRGLNRPELFEVPAQRWADLAAMDGSFGVAVLNDSRHGWDHPDPRTLRLTLVHTPAVSRSWNWVADQRSQDLGRHRVSLALYAHDGDWRDGVVAQADRLNQRLSAFRAPKHEGALGRAFSLLSVTDASGGTTPIAVRALKRAEDGDELVIRLLETSGEAVAGVRLDFAADVIAVRELNAAEEVVAVADGLDLKDGDLRLDFAPFQPRTLALRLADAPVRVQRPAGRLMTLDYDLDGMSGDDNRRDGDFDGRGRTLAKELLPRVFERGGVPFGLGLRTPGAANVLTCRGQTLAVPDGGYEHVYLLAASVDGGRAATFAVDGRPVALWIQDWAEPIGQWDSRLLEGVVHHDPDEITPAYVNRAPVAWVGTHRHGADGRNEAYALTQIFRYRLDLPPGAAEIRLPDDLALRILAATAVRGANDTAPPVVDLYDRPVGAAVEIRPATRRFLDETMVTLTSPNPYPTLRYTLDTGAGAGEPRLYDGPFVVNGDCRVTAWAESPDAGVGRPVSARFERLIPRAAPFALDAPPAGIEPGLSRRYFEGAWSELPDFAALETSSEDVAATLGLPDAAAAEDIGLVLEGYLRVPERGLYRLHLWSDDGSRLALDGETLIDNDGLHGSSDVVADAALEAGWWPLRLEFFQHLGGVDLRLEWEGPGVAREDVPAAALWRRP